MAGPITPCVERVLKKLARDLDLDGFSAESEVIVEYQDDTRSWESHRAFLAALKSDLSWNYDDDLESAEAGGRRIEEAIDELEECRR